MSSIGVIIGGLSGLIIAVPLTIRVIGNGGTRGTDGVPVVLQIGSFLGPIVMGLLVGKYLDN